MFSDNTNQLSTHDLTYSNNLLDGIQVTEYRNDQSVTLPKKQFEYSTNNGNGWNATSTVEAHNSVWFSSGNSRRNSAATRQFVDVNGDGLPDNVYAFKKDNNSIHTSVSLNTGNGFSHSGSGYGIPSALNAWFYDEDGDFPNLHFADVNGDGLVDMGKQVDTSDFRGVEFYLNNGNGWNATSTVEAHNSVWFSSGNSRRNSAATRQFVDVNGDGLPDNV